MCYDKTPPRLAHLFHCSSCEAVTSSCRPLKRTHSVPPYLSRHCRAGLSHDAATRLLLLFFLHLCGRQLACTRALLLQVRQLTEDLEASIDFFPGERLQTLSAEALDDE